MFIRLRSSRVLGSALALMIAVSAACGSSDPVAEEGVVYATWDEGAPAYEAWEDPLLTLDMNIPADPDDAPIVIYLPGGGETSAPKLLVNSLVDEGVMVFVARHARSKAGRADTVLRDDGLVARAKADSVGCAIRFAREQARSHGNSNPVVVLSGFSIGAGAAAHAALFGANLEERWDQFAADGGPAHQVSCVVAEGSTHVDALVAIAGPYDVFVPIYDGRWGRAYQQEFHPEL